MLPFWSLDLRRRYYSKTNHMLPFWSLDLRRDIIAEHSHSGINWQDWQQPYANDVAEGFPSPKGTTEGFPISHSTAEGLPVPSSTTKGMLMGCTDPLPVKNTMMMAKPSVYASEQQVHVDDDGCCWSFSVQWEPWIWSRDLLVLC